MESIEELIAERSAILSEMFGFTREEADEEARKRILEKYRLDDKD